MWKGRFRGETDVRVRDFTQSLDLDWCLAEDDIRGSLAHARMLERVGIISQEDLRRIEEGLSEILEEIRNGSFEPDPALEDVHMNVEARLTAKVGPSGAKLHSGRSRNDQVATAVRLHLRRRLKELKGALGGLLKVLLELSVPSTRTFWMPLKFGSRDMSTARVSRSTEEKKPLVTSTYLLVAGSST